MTEEPPSAFSRLHPAVQHHVVNSLGWRSLRELQLAAIEPILDGKHVVATAPTAGGKTEAAVLPLMSRMLTEEWRGLSVLYVCPLRALLNDLHQRLETYCSLFGRTVGLWHGDTAQGERKRLLSEAPDMLLTTPESIESMLVSRQVEHQAWFKDVQSIVVDEAHAFVGDDRGWHLLAVLERVACLAGREVQRIALSATLGNPGEILSWMTSTSKGAGISIGASSDGESQPEVTLDFVGSLSNAALVVSRLHRGEKRLVFVDSRARAEQLALMLRNHGVTSFVSHGSLGQSERRAAEQAFSQDRDCAIVATSTLELGIDVGDLDRVIQVDAPPSVAGFLQRIGRTGRRPETTRNALVLATDEKSLLKSVGVLLRWGEGYVEPVVPPPKPFHLVAQQILALSLQENGIGRHLWAEWLGNPFIMGLDSFQVSREIADHLLGLGYLTDDNGLLGIGRRAEEDLGRRHFMELLSVFTSPPMFSVRDGRREIGLVPDEALLVRHPGHGGGAHILVLAGRSWAVNQIDWQRRVVQVNPAEAGGVARWSGAAQPTGAVVARGIREVLTGADPSGTHLSKRASERLDELRDRYSWAKSGTTTLVRKGDGLSRWWTFAGWKANLTLGALAASHRKESAAVGDLWIAIDPGVSARELANATQSRKVSDVDLGPWVSRDAIKGLKFSECLPEELAEEVVTARLEDPLSAGEALSEPLLEWHIQATS